METKLGTLTEDLHSGGCAIADVCGLDGKPTGEQISVYEVSMVPPGKSIPNGAKVASLLAATGEWCVYMCDCCPIEE